MSAASESKSDDELRWSKTRAGTERGSNDYTGHETRYSSDCGRFVIEKLDERGGYGHYRAHYEDGEAGAAFERLRDAKEHCEAAARSGGLMQIIGKEIRHLDRSAYRSGRDGDSDAQSRFHVLRRVSESLEAEVRQIDFSSDDAHDTVVAALDRRLERIRTGEELAKSNWSLALNPRTGSFYREYSDKDAHPKTNAEALMFYEERLTSLRGRIMA